MGDSQGYTMTENWGGQLNFMVPLDGGIVERCKSIAKRQEEKMQLNYELVRIDNCAKLQQKGFMLRPGSRVYHLCHDVIPIAQYQKQQKEYQDNLLNNPLFKMSTLSEAREAFKKAKEAKKTEKKETTKTTKSE